jgi:polysaccharide export outer membrane protein
MALARYSTGLLCWITLSLQAFAGNSPAAGENRLAPLGAGDSVSIQVYEQPNMNSTVYVGNDGAVNLPLAGAVHVAGLTPIEAAQRVQDALKSGKFLKDPHVTITVVQSSGQRVSVLGEVHQPGRYPIDPSTTVLDLLAEAGGLTDQSADVIYINRPDQDGKIVRHPFRIRGPVDPENGLASRTVQSGDSVVVPVAEQFYIYGEVAKPNKYRLQPDTTVIQAISLAGGLTPRGSDRRVQIKRMGKDGRYVIVHGGPSDFVLPDDVIRVRQSIF